MRAGAPRKGFPLSSFSSHWWKQTPSIQNSRAKTQSDALIVTLPVNIETYHFTYKFQISFEGFLSLFFCNLPVYFLALSFRGRFYHVDEESRDHSPVCQKGQSDNTCNPAMVSIKIYHPTLRIRCIKPSTLSANQHWWPPIRTTICQGGPKWPRSLQQACSAIENYAKGRGSSNHRTF